LVRKPARLIDLFESEKAIVNSAVSQPETGERRRVVIVQKSIPAYRVPFFTSLRQELEARDIEFVLVGGDSVGADRLKADESRIEWAHYRLNRRIGIGGRSLVWQPVINLARGSDLVIVEQASKLLVNYVFLFFQSWSAWPYVGLWGHGGNLQKNSASRIGEFFKVHTSRHARWWFAYTEGTRRLMTSRGIPDSRITVVQNSIDTATLRSAMADMSESDVVAYRVGWKSLTGKTAVYIGSLYPEKRLQFLVQACTIVAAQLPHFRLLIAGDGSDRRIVEELASTHRFVTFLGRVDGKDRVALLRIADCIVMPGLVGLAIVDAFAAEAPMVTTGVPYHSPEIEYLEDEVNGIMVGDSYDPDKYAEAVLRVLCDEDLNLRLRAGCELAAERYTNDAMVKRFVAGIEQALETTRRDVKLKRSGLLRLRNQKRD